MLNESLEQKINKLTPEMNVELEIFIDNLLSKRNTSRKLSLDWIGGLNELDMDAVDLQHKANEWRTK